MNPKKWEKAKTKLLIFFILGILGISFLLSSCGTNPLTKALLFNIGSFAVDFSAAPSDVDTPADFSEVGFLGLGRGTDRLNDLTEFTIEGWVKSTTSTAGSAFQGGILSRAHDNYGCELFVNADPKFAVKPRATTSAGYIVSSGVAQDNSTGWTHVAGVFVNQDHSAVHAACTATVGQASSIAIDSSDNLYISYYDNTNNDLKYATNASGSWETARLSTRGGNPSSIAIDSSNNVHISYYDGTSQAAQDLRYMTCASGANCTENSSPPSGWSDTLVDGWGKSGNVSSIAADSTGKLHVAFYLSELKNCSDVLQTSGDLKYATCDPNTSDCAVQANWTRITVDSTGNVGNGLSLAIDSSNNLHISYFDASGGDLEYATCSSGCTTTGNWTKITVTSTGEVGYTPSLAIDSSDNLHIVHYDNVGKDLEYATCSSGCTTAGNWSLETIDSSGQVGSQPSLAIDSSDVLHISYYDADNTNLKYATCSSTCTTAGNWTKSTLDDGDARDDTPHIDIYVNGTFQACGAAISIGPSDETTPLCGGTGTEEISYESNEQIGRSQVAWSGIGIDAGTRLEGIVDEVRFWRVARTQSQIQQCMSRYLAVDAGDCSIGSDANGDGLLDLGGYWMLNEGSGTGINDASGAGSNGSKNYCDSDDGDGDGNVTDDPGDVNCAGATANSILWEGGWTSDTPF